MRAGPLGPVVVDTCAENAPSIRDAVSRVPLADLGKLIDISLGCHYTFGMTVDRHPPEQLLIRMRVGAAERVHKLFIIHGSRESRERGVGRQFRVLTKENSDGTLELLGYTYSFDGAQEHQSDVLRSPKVPREKLIEIIRHLVEQTHTDIGQMEVIDLTTMPSRLDQADRLAQRDILDAFEFE